MTSRTIEQYTYNRRDNHLTRHTYGNLISRQIAPKFQAMSPCVRYLKSTMHNQSSTIMILNQTNMRSSTIKLLAILSLQYAWITISVLISNKSERTNQTWQQRTCFTVFNQNLIPKLEFKHRVLELPIMIFFILIIWPLQFLYRQLTYPSNMIN
mgnify:FL=1